MKEKIRAAVAAVLLTGLIILCWQMSVKLKGTIDEGKATSGIADGTAAVIILDPGHGGKDPGKIGVNGV